MDTDEGGREQALRLFPLDGFGNIRPRAGDTWIDFLNVVKYPPSITFSLLTMGTNLIILGLLARTTGRLGRSKNAPRGLPNPRFGPGLPHLPWHGKCGNPGRAKLGLLRLQLLLQPLSIFGRVPLFFYLAHLFLYAALGLGLTPDGTNLSQMYACWLLGLALLYPVCRWYGWLKRRQPAHPLLRFV